METNPQEIIKTEVVYGYEAIVKLTSLEAVRHRPAMYVGSTEEPGIRQLFLEVFSLGVVEAMSKSCDQIGVKLHGDRSVSIHDNSPGIPQKRLLPELTMLSHKWPVQPAPRRYELMASYGTGLFCISALSEWMETTIWQSGKQVTIRTERGVVVGQHEQASTSPSGTYVRFKPDSQIFGEAEWAPEKLLAILRQQAFLLPHLTITFTDESLGCDPQVLNFPGGVAEWAREHVGLRRPLHENVIAGSGKKDDVEVDVAFFFTQEDPVWLAFGNGVQLGVMGTPGTPLTGFRQGVSRTLGKWAKKFGREFEPRKARAGVAAILSVRVYEPLFNGPMKDNLQNPEAASAVWAVTAEAFEAHLTRYPDEAEAIVSGMLGPRGV